MNTAKLTLSLGLTLLVATAASAQFSSGSDGSDGALNITANTTLDLSSGSPDVDADGVLHYTTITVASGATLTFVPNDLNTPIHMLATGDVLIEGTIDLGGKNASITPRVPGDGGPGGFAGGWHQTAADSEAGDGHGPGGGDGGFIQIDGPCCNQCDNATFEVGSGSFGGRTQTPQAKDGATYGSGILIPLIGGSGGGGTNGLPGFPGGGGGGALLIASTTRIDINSPGQILSVGGKGGEACNSGSGGAIRLLAPIVAGDGLVDVNGGLSDVSCYPCPRRAGHGRIRIDALDRSNLALDVQPNAAHAVGSLMLVEPAGAPTLSITMAGGEVVGPGPTSIFLPFGTATTQDVVIQASGFADPIDVVLTVTPESGAKRQVTVTIDMDVDPDMATGSIEFVSNTVNQVHAWVE